MIYAFNLGLAGNEECFAARSLPNGSYTYFAGYSVNYSAGDADFTIIKTLQSDGSIVHWRNFGGISYDILRDLNHFSHK